MGRVGWKHAAWCSVVGSSGSPGLLRASSAALAEAAEARSRSTCRRAQVSEQVVVAGADPLTVTGSILRSVRVPTRRHARVIFRDGVVVDDLRVG